MRWLGLDNNLMTAADKSLVFFSFADLKSALSAICRLEVGVVGRLSAKCRQNCRLEVGIWRKPEAYSAIYGGIGIFQAPSISISSRPPQKSICGFLPVLKKKIHKKIHKIHKSKFGPYLHEMMLLRAIQSIYLISMIKSSSKTPFS